MDNETLDLFAKAWGWKQVGVIVHGGGTDLEVLELEAECDGFLPVRQAGHTRLYKPDSKERAAQ